MNFSKLKKRLHEKLAESISPRIRHFCRKRHSMNSAAFLLMNWKFCRFAALSSRPLEGQSRHFCRKSRFAESAAKVPEMRFHALIDFSNRLIFNSISDKGRLPIDSIRPSLPHRPVHHAGVCDAESAEIPD